MSEYVTTQGDTWDQVALKAYGSEYATQGIMAANGRRDPRLLCVWRFGNRQTLIQPALAADAALTAQLPVWRRTDA